VSPSSGVVSGFVAVPVSIVRSVCVSLFVPRRAGWMPRSGSIPSAISCFELRVEWRDEFDGIDGIGERGWRCLCSEEENVKDGAGEGRVGVRSRRVAEFGVLALKVGLEVEVVVVVGRVMDIGVGWAGLELAGPAIEIRVSYLHLEHRHCLFSPCELSPDPTPAAAITAPFSRS